MSCLNNMQDCRAFTDYTPNCQLNETLYNKYGNKSSSEYRYFLQRNACYIMNELRDKSKMENPTGCVCNFQHPPHDYESNKVYNSGLGCDGHYQRFKNFNRPLPAHGTHTWTNYC